MHLECLAGGGPQGAVAKAIGQLIDGQVQLRRDPPPGAAQPEHHLPILLLAFAPVVPVVLLVTAVKFENLNRALGEVGRRVGQLAEQGLLEVAACGLELLELGWRRRGASLNQALGVALGMALT